MKFTIKYRKNHKPIILFSNEKTIESIANDFSDQLAQRYKAYLSSIKKDTTEIKLARYRLGQKYLIIAALESLLQNKR